jgi:hypothetical protein
MAKNTNPVLDMFRSEQFDSSDPWGSALSAQFDIAECLFRYGVPVPEHWEFSPGLAAGGELTEDDSSWFAMELDLLMRQGHVSNIIHAGNVLARYVALCESEGLAY